ncbi:MAG TPA: PQQ-dependent sugar dehydrogenase, partial [Planctomycetota bacterium]|nr:PQQ-dependent sugar dehydrogenase [Planctomycetota bacterium]
MNLPPDFVSQTIASGFTSPVGVAWAPDGRMFVTEKQGKVWIVSGGVKLATPFIDLQDEVNNAGDRGLLGLAFDPNFATNQFVYLLLVVDPTFGQPDESGDSITFGRLVRYKANGNVADLSTPRVVLLGSGASNGFIHCHSSHAIGTVRFGLDGSLFVGAGDGAHFDFTDGGQNVSTFDPGCEAMFGAANDVSALRSQYRTMMAGKIFRVDPATGLGLSDNPFFDGNPASVASRVWVSGLRNPFRFTVRPSTPGPGTLYIGDVGLGTWEELNCSPGGGENFGWPCYEGVGTQPSYQSQANTSTYCNALSSNAVSAPLITWNHGTPGTLGFIGNCVAGVAFYTGSSYPIKYRNACFFQDYGQSWLRVAFVNSQNQLVSIESFGDTMDSPVDLQPEPGTGDLVYVAIFSGEVRRIHYTLANTPPTVVATATPSAGPIPLDVQFSSNGTTDPNGDPLTLTWSFGDGTPNSTLANPLHTYATIGTFMATLTAS